LAHGLLGENPQDALVALSSLTTEGELAFNELHPQGVPLTQCGEGGYVVNGIRYYSWSGGSTVTNILEITDVLLGWFLKVCKMTG
jgi:triacylglycerol lipase